MRDRATAPLAEVLASRHDSSPLALGLLDGSRTTLIECSQIACERLEVLDSVDDAA